MENEAEGKEMEAIPEQIEHDVTAVTVFDPDPVRALEQASTMIKAVSQICKGPQYISIIGGKKYPKVEWWTTVGGSKGLFPYLVWCKKLDRPDEVAYEARVEVRNQVNQTAITAAEAICTDKEKNWKGRDEYAIKSMAQTRATAKAFRLGLSFLATMAGLEATPAEEVPRGGFDGRPKFKAENTKQPKEKTKSNRFKAWLEAKNNENPIDTLEALSNLTEGKVTTWKGLDQATGEKLFDLHQTAILAFEKAFTR
jgi:hypothetical protein